MGRKDKLVKSDGYNKPENSQVKYCIGIKKLLYYEINLKSIIYYIIG